MLQKVPEKDENDIVQDGVLCNLEENVRFPEKLEIFHANERAVEQTPADVVFRKSEIDADHGKVIVDEKKDEAWKKHEEKDPVFLQLMQKPGSSIHVNTSNSKCHE